MVTAGQGRASEPAEGVHDVAYERVDEGSAPRIATPVVSQCHGAEARARPGASLIGAQAVGDELLRLALDMECKLLVEFAFDPPRGDQRANAELQIAEIHGSYASFITRPMAIDMRSHSLASIASCRRPDGVSR